MNNQTFCLHTEIKQLLLNENTIFRLFYIEAVVRFTFHSVQYLKAVISMQLHDDRHLIDDFIFEARYNIKISSSMMLLTVISDLCTVDKVAV